MFPIVALLLAAPQVEQAMQNAEPPRFEAWTGVSAGLRPDTLGPGGVGLIGVNGRLGRIRPELVLGLGAFAGPANLLTLVRAGARIEAPWGLYGWLAFAHNHESDLEEAGRDPIPHALGLSENGVAHRSGLEAGIGIAKDFPSRARDRLHGRVGARATVAQFFGSGPPRSIDLVLTLGVGF